MRQREEVKDERKGRGEERGRRRENKEEVNRMMKNRRYWRAKEGKV